MLKCDERRLKQVLTNLITNAVKYSFEGGEVVIKVKCLRIENEGWIASSQAPRNDDVMSFDNKLPTPSLRGVCDEAIQNNQNQKIQIEIIDNGIGMSEEEIKMALAGNGSQIDKSHLNKNIALDSHGLGMPIVKQLVSLMKGELMIESVKGKGTKVRVGF